MAGVGGSSFFGAEEVRGRRGGAFRGWRRMPVPIVTVASSAEPEPEPELETGSAVSSVLSLGSAAGGAGAGDCAAAPGTKGFGALPLPALTFELAVANDAAECVGEGGRCADAASA